MDEINLDKKNILSVDFGEVEEEEIVEVPEKSKDDIFVEKVVEKVIPLIPIPKDWETPTDDKLIELIEPRIPKVKDGKTPTKTEIKAIVKQVVPTAKEIAEIVLPKIPKPKDGKDWEKGEIFRFSDLTPYEKQVLTWPQGSNGVWVPRGGTTGQKLIKTSSKDFDTEWTNDSGGTPTLQQVTDEWATTTNDIIVPDEAYGAGWNGSMEVPTKNAIYDKIETITSTPWGTDWAIQYNNSGTLWGDTTIAYIDDTNDRLGIQNSTPQVPIHWVSETGSTIDNVVTGSISLVSETLPTAPSGSITAIAMPSGGSGGGISFTNQWSGWFYANGTVYTARIYPCLVVGSTYYKSTNYEEISNTDPNDSDYYDLSLWWGTVSISGETVEYFVEIDVNSGWFSAIWVFSWSGTTISSISGSDPTTAWGTTYTSSSGTAPDAPVSFDYLSEDYMYSGFYENGTYYQYELDTYKNIWGTYYVSGSPVSYSNYDNNMSSYFWWAMSWTLTGSYDGVILRRSTDWGSSWSHINLGSTSSYIDDNFSDDGSGSMWGNTYGGGSSSTFDFYPYWTATAPSGVNIYSSQGTLYSTTITDGNYYILKHSFSGATGKVLDASLSYWQLFSGSLFYDNWYTSWVNGSTVTPTSYWFTGTNQNRDYKAYSYNSSLGIYWQTPLTLSTTSSGGTKSVSGSVTYPSGITTIKILRQVNGGGYTVSKTLSSPTNLFTDDTTDTTWSGNTTVTPDSIVPWTARFDKSLNSVTGEPHLALIETTWSGTRYSKLSFGVAASKTASPTYQAHLISTASTGYLSMVTGRLEISSSLGGTAMTMFGNANIINNASSSSTHFQVKGANDASLINTRSDMDTVGFGQAIGSDQQTTVQIQPARSSDAGLVMKWHASQSDSSTIIRIQTSGGSYTGEITVGGWVRTSTGAVANPSHSCRSDTNTGIYFPASDVTWFVAWWVEQARVDTGGTRIRWGTASSTFARVSGTLTASTTAVGNVGTGEDNLIAYTVPWNLLTVNLDRIEFNAAGTFAANANNKRIRVYFGTTVLFDTTALAFNSGDWCVTGGVIRTGAATQKAWVRFSSSNTLLTSSTDYTTPTMTLSSNQTLKLTGEATSNDDIKQELLTINYLPV